MSFIKELQRRNVIKVGAVYVVVAWLLVQIADTTFPILQLPDWTVTLVTVLLLIGFPIALIFAWAFELTPEGIKLEKNVVRSESITHLTGRKLDFYIIGLMAVAIIYLVLDNYVPEKASPPTIEDVTTSAPAEIARSIAVLPFRNRSASAEDAYFVDGIHDDILMQLTKLSSLEKVISSTSMEQYRDTNKSLPQIGRELGVATILEGGVQRAGDRVRINVQLIDAATDEHLWAESFDRQLTAENIFAIQSEIAIAVAEALQATLSEDEQQRLATVPTESLPALEAYFLGRQSLATRATDNLTKAADLFQRAIELDPDFALAYAGLADAYQLQAFYVGLPQDEMNAKSELAINKALELDDRLGEAYASLGLLKLNTDPKSAEAAFKRALTLNPNYSSAHQWYCWLLDMLGRAEESLAHSKIAVELDPLSPTVNHTLGWSYVELGRYDEAMAQFKSIIALDPEFVRTYDGIGELYRQVYGQLDKAVPWFEKVVTIDPGNSNGLAWLGVLVLDLGDVEKAEYWIGRSHELAPDGFHANLAMHLLHVYRGEDDQATDYAQKVLDAFPREWSGRIAAAYLRDRDMQSGRYIEARARYATAFPELLTLSEPEIDGTNYGAAINLALVLFATGEQERANMLLDLSKSFIDTIPRLGFRGFWVSDVQIYALKGNTAAALAALRQAIDSRWRSLWWYYLKHDTTLDSIRGESEFQAMVKEIETDMAEQLARVHAKQVDAEVEPIPESLE